MDAKWFHFIWIGRSKWPNVYIRKKKLTMENIFETESVECCFFSLSLFLSLFFFFLKIARLSIDGETMGTNIHYPRISGLSTDCFDATFHFESEQRIRYEMRCDAMWCTYKIRLTNVSSNPASVQTLAHFKLIISHFISSKHIIEISLLVRESVCGFYIFAHHLKSNCLECAMPLMSWNHCPS